MIQSITGLRAVELSQFLREEELGWPIEHIFDHLLSELPDGGELITDTFVAAKENTRKMEANFVYSGSDKRVLLGQEYAVLVWAKGDLTQVVGIEKIHVNLFEVTRKLIAHVLSFNISVTGLRADGAYFKPTFRKMLKEMALGLISKPRRDSKWYYETDMIQLQTWAASLDKGSFHYYSKHRFYARSFVMSRHNCAPCIIVVIRPKRSCSDKAIMFRVCTDLSLTTQEIISGHRRRWRIEVVFRDCNQNLGLKYHQGHSKTSERHVAMVLLTYNMLAQIKSESGKTIGRLIREFQNLCEPIRTRDSVLFGSVFGSMSQVSLSS